MDAVRTFNNELSGVYECKPPISRAKMTAVTKSAIKSIKLYKHVVQSVEKFIQKCRPEYKVPGLYVIDSIVRQSRHQFGAEKDVFAPRFAKNIFNTFQHLFKCPTDDKAKIVRVLNLWQKNGVFIAETVQPLLDMANPENVVEAPPEPVEPVKVEKTSSSSSAPPPADDNPKLDDNAMGIVSQILQQAKQNEEQQNQLQHLQQLQQQLENHTKVMNKAKQVQTPGGLDPDMIAQIQQLAAQLNEVTSQVGAAVSKASPEVEPNPPQVAFNKALLDDFDYEDDDKPSHSGGKQEPQPPMNQYSSYDMQNDMEMIPQLNNIPHPSLPHPSDPNAYNHHLMQQQEAFNREIQLQQQQQQQQQPPEPSDMEMEGESSGVELGEVRSPKRRSHSRSRSRSPKRRRSRSRSRSRSRKRRRSRSRSRTRRSKRSRSRDRRERRKERKKKKVPTATLR